MSPKAFSEPNEIQRRAAWLEDLKQKNIVVHFGGTMTPILIMATTIFSNGNEKSSAFT